jgi:hypothetical protein
MKAATIVWHRAKGAESEMIVMTANDYPFVCELTLPAKHTTDVGGSIHSAVDRRGKSNGVFSLEENATVLAFIGDATQR